MKTKGIYRCFSAIAGDIISAFADGAVLFPLLAALAVKTDFNGMVLLASAGIAYIFAGYFFKVPMPVQPFKSIVVGALALGASAAEIRIAGLGIGIFCLLMLVLPVERLEKYIPRHIIHGIQFSLGLLLVLKGVQWAWGDHSAVTLIMMAALIPVAVFIQERTLLPVLGIVAFSGLLVGLLPSTQEVVHTASLPSASIRADVILSLLLPQLALTLTNSVIGTKDTARRYFGDQAGRVTLRRLLISIGAGNIVSAALGGLPFCHGSGGLTAHVKAGAKTYRMNFYIGFLLVMLAGVSVVLGTDIIPHYPVLLMSVLVSMTGWYHMRLADESWASRDLRLIILAIGGVVLLSQNMLYGLMTGVVLEVLRHKKWLWVRA